MYIPCEKLLIYETDEMSLRSNKCYKAYHANVHDYLENYKTLSRLISEKQIVKQILHQNFLQLKNVHNNSRNIVLNGTSCKFCIICNLTIVT